jgi:hypothetical protein
MVLSNAQWFANPGVVYEIDESCRFNDDDSARLTQTFSSAPDSQKRFTCVFWLKRGGMDYQSISGAGVGATTGSIHMAINATGSLIFEVYHGSGWNSLGSTALYRDPSGWYQFMFVYDVDNATSGDRLRMWVNGTRVTNFATETQPTSSIDHLCFSNTTEMEIGDDGDGAYFDGYLAQFVGLDGIAASDMSDFGEINSTTGQWVPKDVSGVTLGTNGFILDFADSSDLGNNAASTDGTNDWTPVNLAAADQMTDSPTANYATINPLYFGTNTTSDVTFSEGNLKALNGNSANRLNFFTSGIPTTGKWAWKVKILGATLGGNNIITFGFGSPGTATPTDGNAIAGQWNTMVTQAECGYSDDIDYIFSGGTPTEHYDGATDSAQNDVFEWLVDRDAGTVQLKRNGSDRGSLLSGLPDDEILIPFVSTYAQEYEITTDYTPSDSSYNVLSTANFPDPTIADPSAYFQPTIYTGDGATTLAVNQGGNSTFTPDFVWVKNRDQADSHLLFDSARAVTNYLISNTGGGQATGADTVESFDSDGFTVGDDVRVNTSGEKYVGWQWLESDTAGFDVFTFTGTGSAHTISHSLGVVPELIIIKNQNITSDWWVYHAANTSAPETDYLALNTTGATTDSAAAWNDTAPTSSVFSVGTASNVNGDGNSHIAYIFAGVENFSKYGSYVGNGSIDGPFVWLEFKPSALIVKRATAAGGWPMWDNARSTYNVNNHVIEADATNAGDGVEWTAAWTYIDFLSNGFKIRGNDTETNSDGSTYIFAAWADTPFKTATAR